MNDYEISEALKNARRIARNYGSEVDGLSCVDLEALDALLDMFEPYAGDKPGEAVKRAPHPCKCSNCDYTFVRMFLPANKLRAAFSGARGAVCPRCYANTGIKMVWDTKANKPPIVIWAAVASVENKRALGSLDYETEITLRISRGMNSEQRQIAVDALRTVGFGCLTVTPE